MTKKRNAPNTGDTSNNFNRPHKYNIYEPEIKAVRKYLSTHTATATMVAQALNIYRPNLCRHKAELEKMGLLKELHLGICEVTKFKARYLTTNEEIIEREREGWDVAD